MRTHSTPRRIPVQALTGEDGAVVIASMREVRDGVRGDQPLFRLVRIRLTAGRMTEEHLVRVERQGTACLTHGGPCSAAREAAQAFLMATGVCWEETDGDDRDEAGV